MKYYAGTIEITVKAVSEEHAKRLVALAAKFLEKNRNYIYKTEIESLKEKEA